jgi:2-methylisocitrate lyase-like PEP mutase family enzyme
MSETARSETSLSARLAHPPILVAPGVYDPLTALIAQRAGFEALYVSGAAIAYTRLGRPDIGLVSLSEVVDTVALIRDRVGVHLIVDADTGYGNALNVERTVRLLERAGANVIQIEDQDFPKRCGHLDDKALIPAQEMAGKIKAAVDARASRASTAPWRARRPIAKPAPTFCSPKRRGSATSSAASSPRCKVRRR